MPLECCQMLSVIASEKWGHGYGTLPKADGTPYRTTAGAFRHHPCTMWANDTSENAQWLIAHGFGLCDEYYKRYGKEHTCLSTLTAARTIFPEADWEGHTEFVRAMPDMYKLDTGIDTFTAYKMYIASKPWASENYVKLPSRKPNWI